MFHCHYGKINININTGIAFIPFSVFLESFLDREVSRWECVNLGTADENFV